MSTQTYILCPGQGAQAVGMGKDFYEKSPEAKKVFDQANQILNFDLATICFTGPEDRLNQTDIAQPAIFVTSVASFQAAQANALVTLEQVTAIAGLSLGEYTALHLAGALSFEDTLKLVAARGRYMQEAAVANPSGMVSIMGAGELEVEQFCRENAQGEVLVPANFNSPGQIVVSGTIAACDRVAKSAEAHGFKAIPLKVAGAFHSPLMKSAAAKMTTELDRVEISVPRRPVYANVTGQPHGDAGLIKALLVSQIISPVRWEQTMQTLVAAGDARYIELAPGRVLTGLLKKINRRLPIDSFATAEILSAPKAS